jgi:hypothetical protein
MNSKERIRLTKEIPPSKFVDLEVDDYFLFPPANSSIKCLCRKYSQTQYYSFADNQVFDDVLDGAPIILVIAVLIDVTIRSDERI